MTATHWPRGLLAALVTPMRGDELNESVLPALLDFHVESGTKGLVVGGGTGEFGSLNLKERSRLTEAVVGLVNGRIPVIAQTGCLATRDAIELSHAAEQSGAAGLLVASPFGESITWRERYGFYESLTRSVGIPVMIYNTPPSGLLTLDQLEALLELPNVDAVKDSSGDPVLLGDLLFQYDPTDVAIYVGSDSLVYDGVVSGAWGAVLGAASFIPGPLNALVDSIQNDGRSEDSWALWREIRPFLRFLEQSPNYVSLCKVGCRAAGIDVGDVRSPYLMPDGAELGEFSRRLTHLLGSIDNKKNGRDK